MLRRRTGKGWLTGRWPFSQRQTVVSVTPRAWASCSCVSPLASRIARTSFPVIALKCTYRR